ncbi:MAG TPA: hypothetical protein VKL22_04615 [Actinomycetota bacterium]|nr:hypothetical protein [Actinomycetota bacterium]
MRRPGFADSVLVTLQDLGGWRETREIAEALDNEEPRNVSRSLGNMLGSGIIRKHWDGDRCLWRAEVAS